MNKIRKRRDNLIYYASKTEVPTFKYTIETSTDNYACNFPVSQIEDTMVVNWGDGTTEQFTNVANISHTYTNIGTYQISISHLQHLNKMPRFNFQNSKILKTVDTPFLTMYSSSDLEITEVKNMFYYCTSLTTIPAGLFDNNTAVVDFSYCFSSCYMLKLNSNIFCDEGTEKATRFSTVNKQIDFRYCFNVSRFTGKKGTAPALWEYTYSTTPLSTNCFNSNIIDSQITNASDVPAEWKS